MQRQVQPELLDELSPADPRALASRADLRRLNTWMANGRLAADALISAFGNKAPSRIVELGAGDGNFLLGLGRRLGARWPGLSVMLVDRQNVVQPPTLTALGRLGWRPQVVVADVFDWFRQSPGHADDALVANLFLHHFTSEQLVELLRRSAGVARVFVAVEPRRSKWAFLCSRLVGLAGCSAVTRHDAPVSVQAGFTARELGRLWPRDENWELQETAAGLFSHLFVARKTTEIRNAKSGGRNRPKSPEVQATGKTAVAETWSFGPSIFAIPSAFGFRNSDCLR